MPLWNPSSESIQQTNLAQFMATLQVRSSFQCFFPRATGAFTLTVAQFLAALEKSVQYPSAAAWRPISQAKEVWRRDASGDPARDVALLHRLSCTLPEEVWPGVLQHLNLPFDTPPTRCSTWRAIQMTQFHASFGGSFEPGTLKTGSPPSRRPTSGTT